MNISDIEQVKRLLSKKVKISLIPHKNPDGDAMGSCLGLYHYFKLLEYDVTVVSPNNYPEFLQWLPGNDRVLIYDNEPEKATQQIKDSQLIFTLDFNHLKRADSLSELLEKSSADFVMIDHHEQPDVYAKVTYSDVKASSTCAMVYKFIDYLGGRNQIDATIATCLYTGIMTDTGSFRFRSTTANTHKIVAFLIEKGADNAKIYNNVFDSNSYNRLQLLGQALRKLNYLDTYKTAYIVLTAEDLKKYNFKKGDTEGFVNYGLSIKEAEMAVIIIEHEGGDYVRMSFRSKDKVNVNLLAREYFDGGGHFNASGGRYQGNPEQAEAYLLEILPKFLNQNKDEK